jgi:hypothetical protein
MNEVVQSDDIFEIDLKAAFDSLSVKHIAKTLHKHGLPRWLVHQMTMLSISPVIINNNPIAADNKNKFWYEWWSKQILRMGKKDGGRFLTNLKWTLIRSLSNFKLPTGKCYIKDISGKAKFREKPFTQAERFFFMIYGVNPRTNAPMRVTHIDD